MIKSFKGNYIKWSFIGIAIAIIIGVGLFTNSLRKAYADSSSTLKPLELTGPATPGRIKEVILKTELPTVPEKLEAFKPVNVRKADNTFFDQSKAYAKVTETSIQPNLENSLQIVKEFLQRNGVDLNQGKLSGFISGEVKFSDGKRIVERVTVILERRINNIPLLDAATAIDVGLDNQVVGYSRNEFELESNGKYPIITPQEALNLIPKYQHLISGVTHGDTGYITEISLGYWGLRQENIQPVYFIKGYTDQAKKEDTFNLMIPAIKFN